MSIIVPFPPLEPIPPVTPSPQALMELQINRQNTHEFIMADPLWIVLSYAERGSDGEGGTLEEEPDDRDAQLFRLIPQTDVMPQVQTPDGVQLVPTYVLLGEWDAEMSRWDTFALGGVKFKIVSPIRPDYTSDNVYERKGDVARL